MSGETILIVEDNAALRVGISEMLTLEGYKVLEARHGMDALEVLRGATPDLILSDMAANTVGHPQTDHLRTMGLVRRVPMV